MISTQTQLLRTCLGQRGAAWAAAGSDATYYTDYCRRRRLVVERDGVLTRDDGVQTSVAEILREVE